MLITPLLRIDRYPVVSVAILTLSLSLMEHIMLETKAYAIQSTIIYYRIAIRCMMTRGVYDNLIFNLVLESPPTIRLSCFRLEATTPPYELEENKIHSYLLWPDDHIEIPLGL